MGRRSRKRGGDAAGPPSSTASTRAERDAARRQRAAAAREGKAPPPTPGRRSTRPSLEERPPPLWGSFPLSEILTFAGIVLMVWGFAGGGSDANAKLAAGLVIASLGGLELAVREHVTGFRSHTTLLSGIVAVVTIVVVGLITGIDILGPLVISGAIAFAVAFYGLRELFKRRSGGASFR